MNLSFFKKLVSLLYLFVYFFSLFGEFFINNHIDTVDKAYAQTVLPHDLSITKTLSGTVYPGALVQTVIDYTNTGPSALSGISIIDNYSNRLSFSGLVFSNPDLSLSPVVFSHDTALRRLRRDNIELGTGASGQIILSYLVSPSLPENTSVFNAGTVGISCVVCQDPYTVVNTGQSVGYVIPAPLTPPAPYDLALVATLPGGDTYNSGDFIDIAVDLSNDTYVSGNVMLQASYNTFLIEFVGIVSSGGISFPPATTLFPFPSVYDSPRAYYNNADSSKTSWNGFSLATGSTTPTVFRFRMINDYTVLVPIDFSIGVPDEYGVMSTLGDTNPSNNIDVPQVQGPTFDLSASVSILTGDEVSPGVYSSGGFITFRVDFANSGPARENIIFQSFFNGSGIVSYTGNVNGSPGTIININSFYYSEPVDTYRSGISLGAGETGYVDITYNVPYCGTVDLRSRISLIDNHKTALQFSNPFGDDYITNRARETNTANNVNLLSVTSDGICPTPPPFFRDSVIGSLTSSTTGDVLPGQEVTLRVPFQVFGFSLDTVLHLSYDTGLSFLGLVATGIESDMGIVDDLGQEIIQQYTTLIPSYMNNTAELESLYNNPAAYATGECGFPSFPTGTPVDDPLLLWPYIQSASGLATSVYMNSYSGYLALGYNDIMAHAAALIDTQTAIYAYSQGGATDSVLYQAGEVIYACYSHAIFGILIQSGYSSGQAMGIADQYGSQERENMKNKTILSLICGGNEGTSLANSHFICNKNREILDSFYDPTQSLSQTFLEQAVQTLDDAYDVSLSVSGFQQLLTNRIIGLYSSHRPVVRQYSLYASGQQQIFCPTLNCVDYYNSSIYPNPYPVSRVFIGYSDYRDILSEYTTNGFFTGQWIARSGGYIHSNVLIGRYSDIFIDDFSTSGELLLSKIYYDGSYSSLVGFKFLVNEVGPGSVLNLTADLVQNSCLPGPNAGDHGQSCLLSGGLFYGDTLGVGLSGDALPGEDNSTGFMLTVGYREPYDLTIMKTISNTGGVLLGDYVEVTTTVCNNGTGRSDISLSEEYLPGMVFLTTSSGSTLGVPHLVDASTSRIIWGNITLASGECKFVTTQYQVANLATSGTTLTFTTYGGNYGTVASPVTSNGISAMVSVNVIAPVPLIYTPIGNKEILSSTFIAGDEILYRITYENPGDLTGIMNLYDMYESGLIFSGITLSSQGLTNTVHNTGTRTIMWTGVVVGPFSSNTIELSFTIATGKAAFESLINQFAYDMYFVPDSSITDIDQSNNNSSRSASYALNTFYGSVLEDDNANGIVDGGDTPLVGVTVSISQGGILLGTTTTNTITGGYMFTGLLPGLYTISFSAPVGYFTIGSFTGIVGNGALSTTGTSIVVDYNGYSDTSINNTTLMLPTSVPFCGNLFLDPGESCDDGSNNGLAGYCNSTCTGTISASLCGNGILNTSEQCDDANNNNGDACSATCQFELPSCSLTLQSYQSLNPLAVTINLTGFGFGTMQILTGLSYGDSSFESNLGLTQFTHSYSTLGMYTITATVANRLNQALTQTCNLVVQSSNGGGGGGGTNPIDYCPSGDLTPSYYDGLCGTVPPPAPLPDPLPVFDPLAPIEPTSPIQTTTRTIDNPLRTAISSLNYILPTVLPQTGTPVEELKSKGVSLLKTSTIDTDMYDWIQKISSEVYKNNTNLSYWLDKLPDDGGYEHDRNAQRYIVVPRLGIVAPITDIPKEAPAYTKAIQGKQIRVNNWLQSGVLHYPLSGLPAEVGNMVVVGHSSYFKADKGRYKSIFTALPLLETGDEIRVYTKHKVNEKSLEGNAIRESALKESTQGYDRYSYIVDKSFETDKSNVEVMKPQEGSLLTLVTCTPIGGDKNRWIIQAKIDASDTLQYEEEIKVYFVSENIRHIVEQWKKHIANLPTEKKRKKEKLKILREINKKSWSKKSWKEIREYIIHELGLRFRLE